MKAQFKCSNCGAEISNLNMSWGKKQWLWFIPFILFMIFIPLIMDFWMKDKNDFRADLQLQEIEKKYSEGNLEIFGVIENNGKADWESIIVEAEFFDSNDKFIDEIKGKVCANILPGASEHFKILSEEFAESRWNAINKMKVKVVDAYHSKY
jgi:hypothetical protein